MRFENPARVISFAVIALVVMGIIGCHSYAPNAGHEVVLIETQPGEIGPHVSIAQIRIAGRVRADVDEE